MANHDELIQRLRETIRGHDKLISELRAENERLRATASMQDDLLAVVTKSRDELRAENERLRLLLTSYRLAVRGIPGWHLTPEFYGGKDWAANLIHLRQSDLEGVDAMEHK